MPELPEAETMRRYLSVLVVGSSIRRVEVLREASLKGQPVAEFCQLVEGKRITSVSRRGKALLLGLNGGASIVFRLGMSGRLIHHPHSTPVQGAECGVQKHDRVIFHLQGGESIVFQDLRGFGRLKALPQHLIEEQGNLERLGIEPLGKKFTSERLKQALLKTRIPLKMALLDQSRVCGIGNIYASEILHRCGIHPACRPQSLAQEEWEGMAQAIKEVLEEAIAAGGSSISDYLRPDGTPGDYQNHLRVYGRENKPCYRCASAIMRIKQAGRSTFFCPSCQPVTAVAGD